MLADAIRKAQETLELECRPGAGRRRAARRHRQAGTGAGRAARLAGAHPPRRAPGHPGPHHQEPDPGDRRPPRCPAGLQRPGGRRLQPARLPAWRSCWATPSPASARCTRCWTRSAATPRAGPRCTTSSRSTPTRWSAWRWPSAATIRWPASASWWPSCAPRARIQADTFRLHQTIVNLVRNAFQATPEGGEVAVRTSADAQHVYHRRREQRRPHPHRGAGPPVPAVLHHQGRGGHGPRPVPVPGHRRRPRRHHHLHQPPRRAHPLPDQAASESVSRGPARPKAEPSGGTPPDDETDFQKNVVIKERQRCGAEDCYPANCGGDR